MLFLISFFLHENIFDWLEYLTLLPTQNFTSNKSLRKIFIYKTKKLIIFFIFITLNLHHDREEENRLKKSCLSSQLITQNAQNVQNQSTPLKNVLLEDTNFIKDASNVVRRTTKNRVSTWEFQLSIKQLKCDLWHGFNFRNVRKVLRFN